jgi:hypothetical protein
VIAALYRARFAGAKTPSTDPVTLSECADACVILRAGADLFDLAADVVVGAVDATGSWVLYPAAEDEYSHRDCCDILPAQVRS